MLNVDSKFLQNNIYKTAHNYDLRKKTDKKRLKTEPHFRETYVSFVFHTQININCKKCNIAAMLIFSQFTSIYMPKNLGLAPVQVLIQLYHCIQYPVSS